MNKEQIIKRVLSDECYLNAVAELVADIVMDEMYKENRGKESGKPKFRNNEIVWYEDEDLGYITRAYNYGCLRDDEKNTAKKLTAEEIAATAAPPDAVRWKLYKHSIMFYNEKGDPCGDSDGIIWSTYCPHDGDEAGKL